jgi:ABC-type ATPase involved in cell division
MIEFIDLRLEHPQGTGPILKAANLRVAPGQVGLIIAAAGVGSSRLVATMLGESPVSNGATILFGHNTQKLRRSSLRNLRRRVGIVPQQLCLLDDRSAQLNVALPLEIDGVPRSVSVVRAAQALADLGLASEAGLPIECLPASVQQRVAVARALVRKPDVLIFDQPTDRQDVEGAMLVCKAIAAAAARGATCLVISRDAAVRNFAEAEQWSQWIMAGGSLHSATEVALDNAVIEELLVTVESAPVRNHGESRPNVSSGIPALVRFPISARTAGVQS